MSVALVPRERREIAPGAVHVPEWLSIEQQRHLVDQCRVWSRPPAPMRHTRLPSGGVMSVQTVCLGWHWSPYRYTRAAVDSDDGPVTPFPDWLGDLARAAVVDAYADPQAASGYRPDTALVNLYDATARMGMHQDKDERAAADPVVSFSIGDRCTFRFGNTETRAKPYTDVELHSGDLFVFGGASRFAFHGVPRTQPGTADPACGLATGRINITIRVSGLTDDT